jgi:uncharacterized hydrophobic protein (TIGR00271 family)
MPAKKTTKDTNAPKEVVSKAGSLVKKVFRLSPEEREKVYSQLNDYAKGGFPYYFVTALAAFIISLGLIINSTAVVIGGMLITPILWPMLSFSLAVTRGRVTVMRKSFSVLVESGLTIFFVALFVGYISPFTTYSSEIIIRTSPTFVELLIGFAAGAVAAYSFSSKRLMSNVAGVAVAVAVVPPLCVAGITFAAGLYTDAFGALLLFASNLLAIIVSSMLVFTAEGYFTSTSSNSENTRRSYLVWSFGLLLAVSIPLAVITSSLVAEQRRDTFVSKTTKLIYPSAVITDLKIVDEPIAVNVFMTIQNTETMPQEIIDRLSKIYSQKFNKPVTFNLTTVVVEKSTTTNFSTE